MGNEESAEAWKRVKHNKGAPGVGGRSIDETADLHGIIGKRLKNVY